MNEYKLIRSKRKTLSLEISRDMTLVVRAPIRLQKSEIDKFVSSHKKWIEKHMEIMRHRSELYPEELSNEEVKDLIEKAKQLIPKRLEYYSNMMELYPTAVKITGAKTRFGSCSGRDSICFSYRLMQYPDEAIDYVIVHELAHIMHKNHGKEFYSLIERYIPDYKRREKLLKGINQ